MSILRSSLTFLMIVGFAGAVVMVAARDMRSALGKHSDEQTKQAQELVRTLRGDALLERGEQHYLNPRVLPQRAAGSVLPSSDKQRMKGFLQKLLGLAADSSNDDVAASK